MDDSLASDFVALWQSELTAMAADRELRESWAALAALWASTTSAALSTLRVHESPPGGASAVQPARATPLGFASGPGVDEIEQLHQRIDELERRLGRDLGHGDAPAA